MANHATTEEERTRANKAAEQARADALQMHQENLRESRAARAQSASASAATRADAATDRRVDSVRKEYNARFDKLREANNFAQSVVETLASPTIAKNAPAQVALVMQFGKMLDPDSVVREQEQQMIAKARGVLGTIENLPARIQSGVLLTPQQLRFMQEVAVQYQSGSTVLPYCSTPIQDQKMQEFWHCESKTIPAKNKLSLFVKMVSESQPLPSRKTRLSNILDRSLKLRSVRNADSRL